MQIKVKALNSEPLVENRGPRTCEVRIDGESFKTPTRFLSSQEARAYMATSAVIEPLQNPVYEHVDKFDEAGLKKLSKKNGELAQRISRIGSVKRKHEDSKFTTFFPLRDKRDTFIEETDMVGVLDLQILGGFDIVSIPDFWSRDMATLDVEKKVNNLFERAALFGKFAIPYVDAHRDEDDFGRLLKTFLDRKYPIIGIEYYNMIRQYPVFRAIGDAVAKHDDTLFHMSHIDPHFGRSDTKVSPSLYATLFGIDTLCVSVTPPKGGSGSSNLDTVRRFSPKSCGVLTKVDYEKEQRYSTKDCGCPMCAGKTVKDFYDTYSRRPAARNKEKTDPTYLRQASKVHEAFSALTELQMAARRIASREFKKEYLEKRSDLKAAHESKH